ncbi:glycosyltransferase family 9 protein [Kitasatospora acidiphila]|uniref:Glycosyltransferase family 9 protein n=1 Tax=Kitasatospora acidiphila TaxID=2567942 RepID=A0A540VYU3_9ACTN|nr:glycosyltransferase family 9 protein [Kitasatospora acidiphila]TQF01938.1 glycosyltransferase family 9 protein [Kitasatospora acidiphila]
MSTKTPAPAIGCHNGQTRYPAADLHTTPLGYDRSGLDIGQQLPIPPAIDLVNRLADCTQIEIALHGKLGDSLLTLSSVRAAAEWLALRHGEPVPVTVTGPHTALFARSNLARLDVIGPSDQQQAVIADRDGASARGPAAGTYLMCDPAAPPCWSTDGHAHSDLPARHYLALERRLGVRLPASGPFTPLLYARSNPRVHQLHSAHWLDGLTIAAITATSWPQLKDWGTDRFTETAERIAHHTGAPVRLLLIGAKTETDTRTTAKAEPPRGNLQILHLDGMPAEDLADLLPQTDLVLGNDTGLTHLAALARNPNGAGPQVIGLYARHSHSKWRTGLPHHHAIATTASERMHQGDLCPVRDHLDQPKDADLTAITPAAVADLATHLLAGRR